MRTAADDVRRRQEVEAALSKMLQGGTHTRIQLFGNRSRWPENLIRRLVESGIVEIAGRSLTKGKPVLYRVKDARALQCILDDEELLLQTVFPSYKPAPDPDERVPMLPGLNDGPPIEPAEPERHTKVTTESLEEALESSGVMSTEILLKLLVGMIQLLNDHTDQLRELIEKVDGLDEKVTKLLKELTG
jgi:hypothetical protein